MKYRQWSVASPDAALRSALEGAGLPPLLASILAARGIHSGDQAQQLLSPGGEWIRRRQGSGWPWSGESR